MNLEPAIRFIESLVPGSHVRLPLEEHESSYETMRLLNAAADSVGVKIFRIGMEGNILKFRIVKPRKVEVMPDSAGATVTPAWRGYGDDVRISGETLRQVRLLAGMSRETLARLSDTSYHTIVRAERGRDVADGKRQAAIRKEALERIAQALGVVPALLIRRTERKVKGRGRNNADQGETVRDGGTPGATGARGVDQADGDRVDGDAVRDDR